MFLSIYFSIFISFLPPGFDPYSKSVCEEELKEPTDKRMFVVAAALKAGYSVEKWVEFNKFIFLRETGGKF